MIFSRNIQNTLEKSLQASVFNFSRRLACYHVIVSQTAYTENNACVFLLLTGSLTCIFATVGDAI